jgi:hypothetical protein
VRDLAGELHFLEQHLQSLRIGVQRARKELERDRVAELQVVGAVDLAHAASSQGRDDAEPFRDDVAGRKRAASPGVGVEGVSKVGASSCMADEGNTSGFAGLDGFPPRRTI